MNHVQAIHFDFTILDRNSFYSKRIYFRNSVSLKVTVIFMRERAVDLKLT